ncbi:MAG: ImmA/IrrE family metallo-endopeptidase [Oscillospiraceae bacterium]|jgi:Zn-dependent peptidase ImmA (M78 family)|nr:ImmA/IrrE family metallo-endopeptidase [Oscillospiraceae bacterium]
MKYISEPLSRKTLSAMALAFRKLLGLNEQQPFPCIPLLEKILPLLDSDYNFEVVSKEEFGELKEADTDALNHQIRIREDVYIGAVKDSGRDRFTITHEIAHYILFYFYGIKFNLCTEETIIPKFRDIEWQAYALAGELLVPAQAIKGLHISEVINRYKVSNSCANVAKDLSLR